MLLLLKLLSLLLLKKLLLFRLLKSLKLLSLSSLSSKLPPQYWAELAAGSCAAAPSALYCGVTAGAAATDAAATGAAAAGAAAVPLESSRLTRWSVVEVGSTVRLLRWPSYTMVVPFMTWMSIMLAAPPTGMPCTVICALDPGVRLTVPESVDP